MPFTRTFSYDTKRTAALLDRLSQNLHRIEVKGDSMRQTSPKKERVRS
jgi:DNA replication protein DnaC